MKKQLVSCLFCGENPCHCQKTTSKKRVSTKTKTKSSESSFVGFSKLNPISVESNLSEGNESTSSSEELFIPTTTERFSNLAKTAQAKDLLLKLAITNLWPILSPDEKKKYTDLVGMKNV